MTIFRKCRDCGKRFTRFRFLAANAWQSDDLCNKCADAEAATVEEWLRTSAAMKGTGR